MGATAVVAVNAKALWYLTRGTGVVALMLLTLTVALGVANVRRTRSPSLPRFVLEAVHRSAALLAVAFLSVHIATAVLDSYAPIHLVDAFIPFNAAYRPLWLGLGAVASDLLIALAITSVLRRRLGHRAWRVTHWAAYACWPIALLHGVGTGSDVKSVWMLAITGCCVAVVAVAVVARATNGWPAHRWPSHAGARATAISFAALVPLGLIVWLPTGPLGPGWAKRAGTPSSLLRTAAKVSSAGALTAGSTGVGSKPAFTAQVSGVVRSGRLDGGLYQVHLVLGVGGQQLSTVGIRLIGEPTGSGGIEMTTSRVEVGTSADPALYRGAVTSLDGPDIGALVSNASGARLQLLTHLQIDPQSGLVSGDLTVSPA